jgi:hypothetical protein
MRQFIRICLHGVIDPQIRDSMEFRLLHDVGQLVCQKVATLWRARRVLVRRKDYVMADRIGSRIHVVRRRSCCRIRVNAHMAEVETESWLEEASGLVIESQAGSSKRVIDSTRHIG